jgi:hypothetical protein
MLIFHGFEGGQSAERFAAYVRTHFTVGASVHPTQRSSNSVARFRYALTPPIILVERSEHDTDVAGVAEAFGGHFAGIGLRIYRRGCGGSERRPAARD